MPEQSSSVVGPIWSGITAGFTSFMQFLPSLLGGLLILIVGWFIAKLVGRVVERVLRALHVEKALASSRFGGVLSQRTPETSISRIVGQLAKWFIFLIFIQAAANVLGMPQVTTIINSILLFLPHLVVALAILVVGTLAASFVATLVETSVGRMNVGNPRVFSMITRYAILGFSAIAAVNQLGIATNLINILFAGLVGSLALALGLAFGLGGREVASRITHDWYDRTSSSSRLRAVPNKDRDTAAP